jgi:Luciferase-like monooxygenase
MRFGAFLLAAQFPGQDHTAVLESTVAAAVAAEEAGFDDVWVAEHHFMSYGICPSAITLAGYLLGATRRVAVGTAVSVLPTHPRLPSLSKPHCSTRSPADGSDSASAGAARGSTLRCSVPGRVAISTFPSR